MRQSVQSRKSVPLAKILVAIAFGITLTFVGIIAAILLVSRIRNVVDESKERALVASLHVGMSRKELYTQWRKIGLRSGNGEVMWHDTADPPGKVSTKHEVGHEYVPLSQADFPLPTAENRHPSVEYFIDKPGDLLLWPYDEITIYFDSRDNVSRWKVETNQTGV